MSARQATHGEAGRADGAGCGCLTIEEHLSLCVEPGPVEYRLAGQWEAHSWDHYPHGHGTAETRAALAEALEAALGAEGVA